MSISISVADESADVKIDDTKAAVVFRAARELLMNVLKHADVRAASVSLQVHEGQLELSVRDDGRGFDPVASSTTTGGFGLFSVREQIALLRGTVVVISSPDQGTLVRLRVPLADGTPEAP
jgi:signal transduction histidine kinase